MSNSKLSTSPTNLIANSPMMLACRGRQTDYTPIWLMRQAGRFMPDYRKIRERVGFLELCKNPDLVTQVTLLPIEQLGVDAAIIFADILLILEALGAQLSFSAGDGPVIHNPIRSEEDVYHLSQSGIIENLSYVFSSLTQTRNALPSHIPLIGFCGAPFTLAAYLIEGGAIGNLSRTKTFMYQHTKAWHYLMDTLSVASAKYLSEQIKAGANIVQIFDSWLGFLSPADFETYVFNHSKSLVAAVKNMVPTIYFGTGTGGLLPQIAKTDCQVIGLDWRVKLAREWENLGYDIAIQGNLDPVVLLSDKENIAKQVENILRETQNRPGHIFNLGHGILPNTPFENVQFLVELVHALGKKDRDEISSKA